MILQPWTRARREKETMEKSVKHRQRETLGKVEGISAIQLTVGDAEMEAMGRVNEAHREEDRPHFIVTPLKMGMGIRVWVQPTLDARDMISEVMLRRYDPKEFDMAAEEDFELVTHPLLQGRGTEAHKSKKGEAQERGGAGGAGEGGEACSRGSHRPLHSPPAARVVKGRSAETGEGEIPEPRRDCGGSHETIVCAEV